MAACVCIECGKRNSDGLYRVYTGGSIQLLQCCHCDRFVDKYIEYDAVILLLDVLLLRIQSYRHVLFNYSISSVLLWRLAGLLVLCSAYIKFRLLQLDQSLDFIALQLHFHLALLQSLLEFVVLFGVHYAILRVLQYTAAVGGAADDQITSNHSLRAVLLSSSTVFLAVIAVIWVEEVYIYFLLGLMIPAQLQGFRALLLPAAAGMVKLLVAVTALTSFLLASSICMTLLRYQILS